jgi:hypothetical protein
VQFSNDICVDKSSLDWGDFKEWLKAKYSKNYVNALFCCSRKYYEWFSDVVFNRELLIGFVIPPLWARLVLVP